MAIRKTISSNETGLAYAEEQSIGVLPVSPTWKTLEPNEYSDFGGSYELLARNPINSSRQRKKGKLVSLEASGGFNQDFTLFNSPELLQGFMFADWRQKPTVAVTSVSTDEYNVADNTGFAAGHLVLASGFDTPGNNGLKLVTGLDTGVIEVDDATAGSETGTLEVVGFQAPSDDFAIAVSGGVVTLTSATVDLRDLGLTGGEWIFIGGDSAATRFDKVGNNGFKRIRQIEENSMVIDQSDTTMEADAGTGKTIQIFIGRFLKNETGTNIKRRTYHLERTLGAPDDAQPSQVQAEYLIGAVPNEVTLNIETADKITIDFGFLATDAMTRSASDGLLTGTRPALLDADAFNTSSDVASMRISIVNPANNSPSPLFGYVDSMSITINNNASLNRAVGVLGAFEVSVGTFEVSAETNAYFDTVAAVEAVRQNRDVQLYAAFAFDNQGFVLDIPLIAPAGGRPEVAQDEPIMIPLEANAATAAKLHGDLDHTLSWTFFYYLPNIANP